MTSSFHTGFLRDDITGVLQTSTNAVATKGGGCNRDSNGALVVGTTLAGMNGGFNRDAAGNWITVPFATAAAPVNMSLGFMRDVNGKVVTVTTALAAGPTKMSLGFIRDVNGSLVTQ
jgi:hypothetical protein